MNTFKLPDLGEGLPDAIIREWYVKPGDEITMDQPLVAMETAKALVDVPSPIAGKVEKLFGDEGETIEVGQPLVGFEGDAVEEESKDSGTVVGAIEQSEAVITETATGVATKPSTGTRVKATPAVRALARQLGVDLSQFNSAERITADQVRAAASGNTQTTSAATNADMQAMSPARKAMLLSMSKAHQEVAAVTLCDDADIHAWYGQDDLTLRTLRAIQTAVQAEPLLNSHFDAQQMAFQQHDHINIAIAVDTPHGLYVPVIKNVEQKNDAQLREDIERFKQQAQDRSIPQDDLHGGTIMLSNFGAFAGRYANPILTPPMVAIIGAGRARDEVVAVNGDAQVHRILPLSVTVDHRLITGGETARFLRAMMDALQ